MADGIELSESEFHLLRDLVDADGKGSLREYINLDLWDNVPIHLAPVESREPVYRSLGDKGLLSGEVSYGVFIPTGITYLGRDWLADYRASQEASRARTRSEHAHDYLVALASAAFGVLLGAWLEAVTGTLGALLGLR